MRLSAPHQLIGRDREIALLDEFLDGITAGFEALILEGEPGIGKTSVWMEGLAAARARGYHVLSSRAALSEVRLPFTALDDLAHRVPEQALESLPQPQRQALEIALLRAPAEGRIPDPRLLSVAVLGMLRSLVRSAPVLVAIDDVQWIDRASARVLEFSLRRLETEPMGVLGTRRRDERTGRDLTRARSADRVRRISLEPLTIGGMHNVLVSHLGFSPPRSLLLRIHDVSGGNPFFALEIARALLTKEAQIQPGGAPPVPESLKDLIHQRLGLLPPPVGRALRIVATLSRPTVQ